MVSDRCWTTRRHRSRRASDFRERRAKPSGPDPSVVGMIGPGYLDRCVGDWRIDMCFQGRTDDSDFRRLAEYLNKTTTAAPFRVSSLLNCACHGDHELFVPATAVTSPPLSRFSWGRALIRKRLSWSRSVAAVLVDQQDVQRQLVRVIVRNQQVLD